MRPLTPQSASEQLRATLEPVLGPVTIDGLRRLSGGASRETWSFSAGGRDLILRRDPPGPRDTPGSMRLEADAMRTCHRAGLPVPEVLVDDDGARLGTPGLVMTAVPGETLARKILRDDKYAAARAGLLDELAAFLAGLHALDPADVPGATEIDSMAQYWASYQIVDDVSPTFEKAYSWLMANRPAPSATTIVHGDLRMGNVIVGADGLHAVIDWELVHVGDPLEDLGWFCVKAWRFGEPLEAGGLGTIDELVEAYERAGGRSVDRDALHWWLVQKTLQWGIGCMGQAYRHLSGAVRSHELAAIGRRVAEQEWDLIELLAPDEWAAARAAPLPDLLPDLAGLHGRPTARELLDAVRGYLTDDVMPNTTGQLSFHARVAANMVAIVERELAQPAREHRGDDWASLAGAVRDKLAVANPKHLGAMTATSGITEVADPQALREWLIEHVELLADVADEPIELDLISGGVSNVTVGVRLGPHDLVVRRPPVTAFLPTANDVGREYRFYAALDATGIPTPHAFAFCDDVDVIGAPFYVMERLRGRVPHEAAVLRGMTAAEGRALSERFVDVLADIHAVDIDAVGLGEVARRDGYLERQVRRWTDQWHRAKEADDAAIDELARVLGASIPASPPTTIVHGDYRLGNVMVDAADRTRIVGVFDWEMATLGDPLADLGYTLLYWGTTDRPHFHASQPCADLPGFLTASELTDRYATITGRAVEDITFYVVLAAFKLAIIGEGNLARMRRAGTPAPDVPAEWLGGPSLPVWALDLWNDHQP